LRLGEGLDVSVSVRASLSIAGRKLRSVRRPDVERRHSIAQDVIEKIEPDSGAAILDPDGYAMLDPEG
jgi:hypothetical protein